MLNQLLYSHNKNKPDPKDPTLSRRLLSNAEHSQFVKDMCRDNRKMKQHREQREKGQLSRLAALE